MLETTVLALLLAFPVVGVLTRRWLVVLLPLIAWPVFYAGLDRGWWLDGTGDGWQFALISLTLIGATTTAGAILITRALRRPPVTLSDRSDKLG